MEDDTPTIDKADSELAGWRARAEALEQQLDQAEAEIDRLKAGPAPQPVKKAAPAGSASKPPTAQSLKPVAWKSFHKVLGHLVKAVRGYCDAGDKKAVEESTRRIEALETKLMKAIETRAVGGGGMTYEGVWRSGLQYQLGACVTFKGSLWHANKATGAMPGSPDSGWQLCVKRGRDGKDAGRQGGHAHDDAE